MTHLPPAGWYQDPELATSQRYWDGQSWTPHRAPMTYARPVSSAHPVTAVGADRGRTPTVGLLGHLGGLSRRVQWGLGILAVLILLIAIGSTGDGSDATENASSSRPTSTATAPSSAQSSSTSPATAVPVTPPPTPRTASAKPAIALVAVAGVVDGDTLTVRLGDHSERVRVIGIDTPEMSPRECFAQQATSKMQSLVQSRSVRLTADPTQADRDRYGRLLRHVSLADGRSVAQLLIAGGYGREYTYDRAYAGQAAYRSAQAAAREAGLGVWSAACLAPARPAPLAAPKPAPGPAPKPRPTPRPSTSQPTACVIKGNIASDGERIYHVPGQRFYDVTKIDTAKGERWFCTESQAVAAGWRKAKV